MKQNKMFTESEHIPEPNKDHIDTVIFLGQHYMDTHTPQRTSLFYLFKEQLKYLSPSLWLFQLAAIILITAFAFSQADNSENVCNLLFQIAPLISVMVVPELIKDVLCNMSELENSCKNSGSTILILRLIAVGLINVLVIVLISGVLAGAYNLNYLVVLLYAFVPYNFANIISLFLIRVIKINTRSGALAVSFISAAVLIALPVQTQIISVLNVVTLSVSFLISLTVLTIQVLQILKKYLKGELNYGIENR